MHRIVISAIVLLVSDIIVYAELVDTEGNVATNETYLGDIDMSVSTVGDLSHYVSTGAVDRAVTQANAYTDTKTATKQDKLPYPTNAIPQGAVSGLSTALNGKVEKTDFNTMTNEIHTVLTNKASIADATLEVASYEYGAWVAVASDGHDYAVVYDEFGRNWYLDCDSGTGPFANEEYSSTATEITFGPYPMHGGEYNLTATATRTATPTSYRLGPDDSSNPNRDKPLASKAEAEALRNGKQDNLPYPTNAIPYAAISGKPNLATVATSGSYNDLSDKPTIPTVPTDVSAFNNDAGYVTKSVTNGLLSTSTAADTYQPKGDYALVSALAAAAAAATNHTDISVASAAVASTNYTDSAVAAASIAATNYTDSAAVAAVSTAVSTAKTYTDSSTNAVIQHVDSMDTSYYRFETITNVNQSVQYVATDANTTELRIQMPATGMTKDWLVYIYPAADLNIVLPGPADYWCSSYDVTNSIPAGVPTALYFSQITEGVFSLGRKKLDCPITISSPLTARLRAAQAANRRTALSGRRPAPTVSALKSAAKPVTATAAKPTATAVRPATTNTTATATKK